MKKARGQEGSNNMDRISDLPKEILQRILYFLSQEDVVRTSVLSKSWRNVWRTCPSLDFSDSSYCFKGKKQEFLSVVDKNLQRYCDQGLYQGLCLEEFRLSMSLGDLFWHRSSVSLLERWIPRLTDMGVKVFRLVIYSKYSPRRVKLPSVVFETESLQDLHVDRMIVSHEAIERILLSKHLKRLNLQECIQIEENEKGMSFSEYETLYPTSLETIDIRDGNIWFHKGADFRNLIDLSLSGVKSSLDHLSSCKFPSLERLTLWWCGGFQETYLFIDAPNILRFVYRGRFLPSISFAATSHEWQSDVYLLRHQSDDNTTWFLKLKQLLVSLSQSEISLSIRNAYRMDYVFIVPENILVQDNGCDKPVVVERLYITCDLYNFSSFLCVLFCICHPRNIGDSDTTSFESVFRNLIMQRESGKQDPIRIKDLETYGKNQREWHPISLSNLADYEQRKHSKIVSLALH